MNKHTLSSESKKTYPTNKPSSSETAPPFEGFTTRMVHHDRRHLNTAEGVHTPTCNSVLFGYTNALDLCDVFQGKTSQHTYARQSTPTTNALQSLIALTENSPRSIVFSTGMSAIAALMLALLKNGDHVIASRYLFGNTYSFFQSLTGFGIEVSFVDTCDSQAVEQHRRSNTRIVFAETLANPGTQIPDFEGISALCNHHKLIFVLDTTLTTGYMCQGKQLGAHLLVMSLTKSMNGHGNVLGGAVIDTGSYDWTDYPNIFPAYRKGNPTLWGLQQIRKKGLRDMGGTLSANAAAQISFGAETLALRMDRSCHNAKTLATALAKHPRVAQVYHPSLTTHPQHQRATEHFRDYGALLSLDLKAEYDPIEFLNSMELVIKATHLGDNRTLALPVAKTIFFEMGAENRAKQGIAENMIRCSIGIEDTQDLLLCFLNALDQLSPSTLST